MSLTPSDSLISAICYSDIFGFPLTEKEVRTWAVGHEYSIHAIRRVLAKSRVHRYRVGISTWYSMRDSKILVEQREARMMASQSKWRTAHRAAHILSHIPTVNCIGVTGGLAMNNARIEDDIDLCLIVSPGTVWITRCIAAICMELVGLRRRRHDLNVQDRICLNMILSHNTLAIPPSEQNLYMSHEVVQLVPIFDRHAEYRAFLDANSWVKTFLPVKWQEQRRVLKSRVMSHRPDWYMMLFRIADGPLYALQRWYMSTHITTEVISRDCIRFHPKDVRDWIVPEFKKRLSRYNISLDKIFFGK